MLLRSYFFTEEFAEEFAVGNFIPKRLSFFSNFFSNFGRKNKMSLKMYIYGVVTLDRKKMKKEKKAHYTSHISPLIKKNQAMGAKSLECKILRGLA